MANRIEYHVCVVKRNKVGIDKYYRKDEKDAEALRIMNKNLYPKADVTIVKEYVMEEDKNDTRI